jgi:hypothetical protein
MIGKIHKTGVKSGRKIYPYSWVGTTNKETLFAYSSCARQNIDDFIGRRCYFVVGLDGSAYNIGLIDDKNKIISLY